LRAQISIRWKRPSSTLLVQRHQFGCTHAAASLPNRIRKGAQRVTGLRFDIEIPTCREGAFGPCGFAAPDDVIKCVRPAEPLGDGAGWAADFLWWTTTHRASAEGRAAHLHPHSNPSRIL